jgi:hypothetical protein
MKMKKRELCILVSSLLAVSAGTEASCPGDGHVFAMGWGFTEASARHDALVNACEACNIVYGESCGPVRSSGVDDGWIWDSAWVAVDCEQPCS